MSLREFFLYLVPSVGDLLEATLLLVAQRLNRIKFGGA